MRRSEITPEIIDLSKRAKELGFPQDVEDGDWILDDARGGGKCYLVSDGHWAEKTDVPILSFSRCLEWLSDRFESIELWRNTKNYRWYCRWANDKGWTWGIKPIIAIAKAVVKILEEGK